MKYRNHRSNALIRVLLCVVLVGHVCCANLRSQWHYDPGTHQTTTTANAASSDPATSLIGFIIGPILFFLSFAVVWNNEKKCALNFQRLTQIQQKFEQQSVSIECTDVQKDCGHTELVRNHKHLIYSSGNVDVIHAAADDELGISIPKAIKVVRSVEVREYRDLGTSDGEVLVWVTNHQETVRNKINPKMHWRFQSQQFFAPRVDLNNYQLNHKQVADMSVTCNHVYEPTSSAIQQIMQSKGRDNFEGTPFIEANYIYFPIHDDVAGDKEVEGTLRIKYEYADIDQVSVICGLNEHKQFQPYQIEGSQSDESNQCCRDSRYCFLCNGIAKLFRPITQIGIVVPGIVSQDTLLHSIKSMTKVTAYLFRGGSYLIMLSGIYLLFRPLTDIIGSVPLFDSFKSDLQSYILLGSFLLSVPLYVVSSSIAWVVYNPRRGIPIMLVGLTTIIIIVVISQLV